MLSTLLVIGKKKKLESVFDCLFCFFTSVSPVALTRFLFQLSFLTSNVYTLTCCVFLLTHVCVCVCVHTRPSFLPPVLAAAVTQASLQSVLHKLLTAGPAFNVTALLSAAQHSNQGTASLLFFTICCHILIFIFFGRFLLSVSLFYCVYNFRGFF